MVTIKDCILGKVKAQNPVSCRDILNEVKLQQTELDSPNEIDFELAVQLAIEELIKSGDIYVGVSDNEFVLDF